MEMGQALKKELGYTYMELSFKLYDKTAIILGSDLKSMN